MHHPGGVSKVKLTQNSQNSAEALKTISEYFSANFCGFCVKHNIILGSIVKMVL